MTKLIDQGAVIAAFEAITLKASSSEEGLAIVTRGAMVSFLETVKNLPAHDEPDSLRDKLAMSALGAFGEYVVLTNPRTFGVVANACYTMADAMMKARAGD